MVDNYQDDGRTGTDSDREDFQRLLADIYAKKINCVIVKDLSRLSRNDYECGHYLEYVFVSLDVRFISVELPALDSYLRPEEISSMSAHALGIGSVWLGTWPQMERVERQRQLFRLPDTMIPHSVIALGYPQGDITAPGESRYEEDRVHFEQW